MRLGSGLLLIRMSMWAIFSSVLLVGVVLLSSLILAVSYAVIDVWSIFDIVLVEKYL